MEVRGAGVSGSTSMRPTRFAFGSAWGSYLFWNMIVFRSLPNGSLLKGL